MARYRFSTYSVEGEAAAPMSAGEMQEMTQRVGALDEEMRSAGAWVFSARLHEADTATVVRSQGGRVVTTDGPFAEAKEHLVGPFRQTAG